MRLSVLFAVFAFLLGACSSSKQAAVAGPDGPSARQWRNAATGKWVLNEVEKEGLPSNAAVSRIFEEAPIACFIGSTWNLLSNGKGGITFAAAGELCAPGATRDIFWTVYDGGENEDPQFQFKKLYPGEKAKDVKEGYRLVLDYADEQQLVLTMPINSANARGANLVFKFSRK